MDALNAYLTENARLVSDYLSEHAPAIDVVEPEGTYLMWLDCRRLGLSSQEIVDRLVKEQGMAIMGSAMPATGGSYVYAKRLIGPRASFVYLMIFVMSQVLIATFALGFASYVAAIFPNVNQQVVAAAALVLAVVVNLIGLKTSAKVQKGMVALLLVSLFIYIVFGLPKVNWEYLTPALENVMPNGPMNFLQGAVMLSFACGGAKFLAENGGEVENPGKTIPRAMVVSTILVAVFYALVGVVAAGVLPIE